MARRAWIAVLVVVAFAGMANQDAAVDFSASYSYDLEANPTRIKRMGLTDVDTYGVLNDIRADYRNGRPRSVSDAADAPLLEGSLSGSEVTYGPYTTANDLNLDPIVEVLEVIEVKFNK